MLIEIIYSIIAPWRLLFMSSFSEFGRQVLPNTQTVEKMCQTILYLYIVDKTRIVNSFAECFF